MEAAGPDDRGDAAHSANRPAGGNGRRRRDCRDLAKGPRRGVSPARAKRGRDSSKPDAPEPGSRSVTAQSGNRQVGGGWRRLLDVLDWPRDRRGSAVPARARRSPAFPTPAGRRPALVACDATAGALAGAAGGAMAQGSAAALCGLVFGPAIFVLLATAVERDFAAWRIERRRFGTFSEYVAMRWLGRGPTGGGAAQGCGSHSSDDDVDVDFSPSTWRGPETTLALNESALSCAWEAIASLEQPVRGNAEIPGDGFEALCCA